ncbi:MAG: hypothetical protein JKY25_12575 [Robiginitomaculum sp.]|nr:hypothetical protein [Robiginitomaculum sp.]
MTIISKKLASYPETLAVRLGQVRQLIRGIAASNKSIGMIEESLKWGQISFATLRPKSGTPMRIDGDVDAGTYSLFVPCSTNLIEGFRTVHPDLFNYYGNREIRMDLNAPLPKAELSLFIAASLRYKLK